MWVANELQQSLGLNVHQHRVLQGAAVLRQRLQAALSNPFLRDGMRGGREEKSGRVRNVTELESFADPQA